MNANLRAIMLMLAAMACFTLADMLLKIASQTLPVGQVMMTLGIGSNPGVSCSDADKERASSAVPPSPEARNVA